MASFRNHTGRVGSVCMLQCNAALAFLSKFFSSPPTPLFHYGPPHWYKSLPFLVSHSPSELRGASWQVTRVVKPEELGTPDERLREQMRNLELSPQEGEDTSYIAHVHDMFTAICTIHSRSHTCQQIAQHVHFLPIEIGSEHRAQSSTTEVVASSTAHKNTSPPTQTVRIYHNFLIPVM